MKARYYKTTEEAFASNEKRAVLLLHFNKYNAAISQIAKANRDLPNVLILEDFVQAPFDVSKVEAHAAVTSLRKIGTVELAIAYSEQETKQGLTNSDYLKLKRKAMQLREEFLQSGDAAKEQEHLNKMQAAGKAENNSVIYFADASEETRFAEIDFAAIKNRRTANRKFLEKALSGFEILPSDYFFLMLRLKNRDAVRKHLFSQGIFPPIHWQDSGHADDLLSLPIDQRYDENDMQKLADAFLSAQDK